MNTPALLTESITMQFGGLKAVSDFSIQIPKGYVYGLIGPNGAGKTTVFNILSGLYTPTSGTISVFGKSINGLRPDQINRAGIARTFQNIRLFKNLTVLDHLMIAKDRQLTRPHCSLISTLFRTKQWITLENEQRKNCVQLLEIFKLESKQNVLAVNLPYGDQRRLEIARALATGAKLILLDEPAAGLNPQETLELMKTIQFIRNEFDITVLIIEHDMKLIMEICDQIAVLDYGVKIAEGPPKEIQKNPLVIEAYLGKST